jgi:RHS repeat-associated protein
LSLRVTSITDSNNNIVQSYQYDSFGNIVNQTGSTPNGGQALTQPYTYTGREYDPETGLYYYRARYYDPKIGRFLQEDPVWDVNLYPYVGNNPLNWVDPWGLTQEDIDNALGTVQETQTDLNVPDNVYTIPMPGEGSGITNPFNNTVSINNDYLKPLNKGWKQRLLETLIHESIHRTKPWYDKWLRPLVHNDIYEEARRRREELERKYPDLYKNKKELNSNKCN